MRKYNISANLVRIIEQLYDKATSAVQMNGSIGEWFRTTVGIRQGCLLSPTLFNIFLERIMSDALEEHDGKVSIGGRNITNLRFARIGRPPDSSGNILLFLLPLFQEGQLSVTGESMCTKYWLTA